MYFTIKVPVRGEIYVKLNTLCSTSYNEFSLSEMAYHCMCIGLQLILLYEEDVYV